MPPRTRCAKVGTPKNIYRVKVLKLEHHPKSHKLQKITHTKNEVFPPIVVRIIKSHLFRFKPMEGMKLHLFNENKVIGNCTIKYPIVPFLPKHPNSDKPNNRKE